MSGHPQIEINPEDIVRLELPAILKYLNVLGHCINGMLERVEKLDDREALSYSLQLAVHEACTNIVEHAYEGSKSSEGKIWVTFSLGSQPRCLITELTDLGSSFDPATIPAPNLEEGQVHGYGLFLMHEIMDEVEYRQQQPQGNYWRLTKYF